MRRAAAGLLLLVLAGLAGCAPRFDAPWGDGATPPRLEVGAPTGRFTTADGLELPLHAWMPQPARFPEPEAVVLALHGFNDYANAFAEAGRWLADHGVAVYAYDQRGFGAGPRAGEWPGTDDLVADLRAAVGRLQERHPGRPVYLLGESMGGAVAMAALASEPRPDVAGTILSAPAVWGRSTMPWFQRLLLEAAVRVVPSMTLSGSGLGVWATDNREMLFALSRDPLVIKETRVDAIYGLTGLMDRAYAIGRAGRLDGPVLWLYGARDEIVPPAQTLAAARGLDAAEGQRFVAYPQGYHMLLRDLQGETVLRDILAWITDPAAPLPSGQSIDPALIDIPGPPRPGARSPGVISQRTD